MNSGIVEGDSPSRATDTAEAFKSSSLEELLKSVIPLGSSQPPGIGGDGENTGRLGHLGIDTSTKAKEISFTYNFLRLYDGQLCTYRFNGKNNPRSRNLNEVWDTVEEDGNVDIVGYRQSVKLVHFRSGVPKGVEVPIHLVLQRLLLKSEGHPIM